MALRTTSSQSSASAFTVSNTHIPSKREILWDMFAEFSKRSTIHGIIYLTDRRRNCFEKVWWVLMIALSLIGSGVIIQHMYMKWDQNPIIVSFATKPTPVWTVPFPAITICSETKTKSKYLNFTQVMAQLLTSSNMAAVDNEIKERFEAVLQLCQPYVQNAIKFNKTTASKTGNLIDIMRQITPTMNETLGLCRWGLDDLIGKPCDEHFRTILTDEGFCYTFNMLHANDLYRDGVIHNDLQSYLSNPLWTRDDGHNNSISVRNHRYPHRTFRFGEGTGLSAMLYTNNHDLDYKCRAPFSGYKILLHPPDEVPNFSRHFFNLYVPLSKAVVIAVIPQLTTTSSGLRDYTPRRRQCFYNSERRLRFYKIYTQSNCEIECITNHTLTECGCVQSYMLRDSETSICGTDAMDCYQRITDEIFKPGIINGKQSPQTDMDECECLPSCTSLSYNIDFRKMDFDWEKIFSAYGFHEDQLNGGQNPTRISIFFNKDSFTASRRSEIFGLNEFLANCGGLLGLFMGISILSLVEVFYFCTVRLFFNMRRRKADIRLKSAISNLNQLDYANSPIDVSYIKPQNSQRNLKSA